VTKNISRDRLASFVAGILFGCLVFCIALPWGLSPGVLVLAACGFVLLSSIGVYAALTCAEWPTLGGGRVDIYDCNRGALGFGLAVGVLALFVATFEKFRETFSMEPFEAAFSASIGLGFYLGVCGLIFVFLVKSM
jgi:hypothetical protein